MTSSLPIGRTSGAALLGAAAVALALLVATIHAHSLSGDGAYHLVAGHQALRYGRNTVNLEHPPLVKMVVSLPLLFGEPLAPPLAVGDGLAAVEASYDHPERLRSATVAGRYLALLFFVLPFLVACCRLGSRFGGRAAGIVLALGLALSFSVLPVLTLLQTDVAMALSLVLVILAGARFLERPSPGTAAWLGAAWGLGLASKFSAFLLGPTVLAALLLAPGLKTGWRRRLLQGALTLAVAATLVEGAYLAANRAYSREVGRSVIAGYCEGRGTLIVEDQLRPWQPLLLGWETIDPFSAQWATGFLGIRAQNRVAPYPSYAFGRAYSGGRWWYFPALLLVKVPLAILGLLVWVALGRRGRWLPLPNGRAGAGTLALVTLVVYLGAAIASNYNLGFRHLLPILPLLYLPVAAALARRPGRGAALALVLAAESLVLTPTWLSETNTWWLGDRNPTRFAFGTGNTEYRQSFVQLARVAERLGIEDLHVIYPAGSEKVVRAYLPRARYVRPGDDPAPGWYAVNVMVEQYVPALLATPPPRVWGYAGLRRQAERLLPTWRKIQRGADHGYVAGTFHLYCLGQTDTPRRCDSPGGSVENGSG